MDPIIISSDSSDQFSTGSEESSGNDSDMSFDCKADISNLPPGTYSVLNEDLKLL